MRICTDPLYEELQRYEGTRKRDSCSLFPRIRESIRFMILLILRRRCKKKSARHAATCRAENKKYSELFYKRLASLSFSYVINEAVKCNLLLLINGIRSSSSIFEGIMRLIFLIAECGMPYSANNVK